MGSSLFCPVRKKWVAALPEEKIRQALIEEMTQRLGYPMRSLSLEVACDQLPHIEKGSLFPKRRADLIVFANGIHPQHSLYPLLLIECKATPLVSKVFRQLIGYNQVVGAYFMAAVNSTSIYLGRYSFQDRDVRFNCGLLPYDLLIRAICGEFNNQSP